VDKQDEDGWTALMYAAEAGHAAEVHMLAPPSSLLLPPMLPPPCAFAAAPP